MSEGPIFTPAPGVIASSQMTQFTRYCEERVGRRFAGYGELHAFSVAELERFWSLFFEWSALVAVGPREPVLEGAGCEDARFFPKLELSWVENLLERPLLDGDRPAVTACDETGAVVRCTRAELRARVRAVAGGLSALGVGPGDRVAAVAHNGLDALVACLGATALGASWSAISPDLGVEAMLDRFRPLAPSVLFAHGSYRHHGAERAIAERIVALAAELPGLSAVVSLDATPLAGAGAGAARSVTLAELAAGTPIERWPRLPFNHPLFILFSSGTTGAPKCIVHGLGGTLVEHHKEHRLHTDLRPSDKLLFQTSCGWMMWNWQVSALACGAEILLYDGSVSFPEDDSLWRLVAKEAVTVLGTSPAYLQYCRDAGIVPRERVELPALRAILSTGSILGDSLYGWVSESVKSLPLQSISGGTDIIGCFALGNPNLPVWPGELQCLSLGLDVRAEPAGGIGELVCARPFPSRPLGLHGDESGRRFHDAYFSQNAGVWTHGDFLELTAHGGARIHGRSDGILNIRGIRIGPAEIYRVLESVPELAESMALEQTAPDEPGGTRLVLLVVMRAGATLDRPLTLRIKKELSQRCSMAHVPGVIAEVDDLPTTHSGKRSERAARDALNGREVANLGALRNPDSLRVIAQHPALQR